MLKSPKRLVGEVPEGSALPRAPQTGWTEVRIPTPEAPVTAPKTTASPRDTLFEGRGRALGEEVLSQGDER